MTIITKRVSGAITADTTARVSGAITETSTVRITGVVTEDSTIRVTTSGATPSSVGNDTWGGSWGRVLAQPTNSWGRTWHSGKLATVASPAISATSRVSGAIAASHTKRVTM